LLTNIKSNFNHKVWVLIGTAIVIDLLTNILQITIPVFVFTVYPIIGLLLVAILCGPWAGAVTGLLGQIILGAFLFLAFRESRDNTLSPLFPWWLLSAFMGFFAGKMAQWGYFRSWWLTVLTGFLTAAATTALYIPLRELFFTHNLDYGWLEDIIGFVSGSNLSEFPVVPIIISALLTFFLLKSPLHKFFMGFPQFDLTTSSQNIRATTAQKILGLAVLAIVIPWILFLTFFVLASLH
jgi:energy-coupling factor transport system substrate-specific component